MPEIPQTNTFFSILWSVFSRWGSKLIGMVATIILARLLTPADFGVIAMATLVIALSDALTQAGLNLYILRLKDDCHKTYNTVWTLNILQGVLIALPLIIFAGQLADFFKQPALQQVIYYLALARCIFGFSNVGIWVAQKQLNFKIDFIHTLYTRVIYLIITVAFAVMLGSYWAIVIGTLFSTLLGVILSFFLHNYRPQLSLEKSTEVLSYAKVSIPLSVGRYLNNQADSLVVGRIASTEFLGLYHIAVNLAGMFTKELLMPVIRGLVPNLAVIRNQENFHDVLRLIFASAVYVFLPVGIGLSLVSFEFVGVFLGQQWLAAAPMLFWFSLYGMVSGLLMFFSEQFLVMMEKESLSNKLMWFRNGVSLSAIFLTVVLGDVKDLPRSMFLAALCCLPVIMIAMSRAIELSLMSILVGWIRPVTSVLLMILGILALPAISDSLFIMLMSKVFLGGAIYCASLMMLGKIFGINNNSIESLVYKKFVGDKIE